MPQIDDQIFAELLYRALEAERGIAVETNDVTFLKQNIWRVKGDLGDPRLDALMVVHAPVENEVWICQRDQDL
jgi:hypothetical protein